MHLVCVGDSWCYGSDLGEHRKVLRYSRILGEKLEAVSTTNISKPGISNSYMIFSMMNWLADQGYLSGEKDPSQLFISIGWTSPERFDIFPDKDIVSNQNTPIYWRSIGPWLFDFKDKDYPIDTKYREHLEFFYAHCKTSTSDYSNWVLQVIMIQNFLENLGIRFLMHQAIYKNDHYQAGHDIVQHESFVNVKKIWQSVNSEKFFRKDLEDMSLYSYLQKYHSQEQILNSVGDHPVKRGHEIIAELLHKHILEHNL